MYARLSRPQHQMPARGGHRVGQGGGGSGGVRDVDQTDMRGSPGWLPAAAGPCFVVRARCLGSSVTAVAAAHSGTADALARGCRLVPAASLTDVVQACSVGVRRCPAEAGELTRDSDRHDRAALAALCVQALPGAMQPALRLPADRDDVRGLPGLAALEHAPGVAGGGSARPLRPAAGGRARSRSS